MDGLLMKKLTSHSLTVAAIALATIGVRDVHSAALVVPPDPSTMQAKALVSAACSKCHGVTGVSISPLFPILAAQVPGYIEAELKLFRIRGRGA
jgi:cytochrome c553